MGRKIIEIDWKRLDSYLQFRATKKQCALLLDVSEDTIERRIKSERNMTFTEYAETKIAPIRIKLASRAISKALDGDNTMLIFCLKNFCGWSDNQNVQHQGDIHIKIDADDAKL